MITTSFQSKIFKRERRQTIASFISRERRDFKNLTKRRIIDSKASGRLYRRKGGQGFKRSHRASARGQRPAIDSGKLLNSIQDKRRNDFSGEVFAGADYAKYLQSEKLNRPIMVDSDVDEAQAKANRNGLATVKTLL